MVRKFVQFFGSLKVAIAFMIVIAILMVYGSFFAIDLSNGALRRDFYRSVWFNGVLGLFALSMICATLKRDPFHLYQIPFVITHGGILVILFGAMLSNLFKVYGMVSIPEGGSSAVVEVEDEREVRVWVRGLNEDRPAVLPEQFNMYRSREANRIYPVEGTPYSVAIKKFVHNARIREIITDEGKADHPAARVQLHFDGNLEVDTPLFARPRSSRERSGFTQGALSVTLKESTHQEYQEDAARYGDLSRGRWGTIRFRFGSETRDVDVKEHLKQPLAIGTYTVTLESYIPDVRQAEVTQDGAENTDPVNPAVYFLVQGPDGTKRYATAESRPDLSPFELDGHHRKGTFEARYAVLRREGAFRIYLTEQGPKYLMTSGKGFKQAGDVVAGQIVPFPWMDRKLQITVPALYRKARSELRVDPLPDEEEKTRIPALYVEVISARGRDEGWISFAGVSEFFDGDVQIQYAPRRFLLDFTLQLDRFRIVYYPGSDTASLFESRVVVRDDRDRLERTIRVNEPLHYRGFIFYQTSYSATPEGYVTHLSASRDPGIYVVYIGFVFLVAGVLGMFYVRPALMKRYRARRAAEPARAGRTAVVEPSSGG